MFGCLKILAGSDFLFVEQLIAIVAFLSELDFGSRRSAGILIVRESLEIIGLSLIDIGGFEIRQLLSFFDSGPLAGVQTHNSSFVDRTNNCFTIFRDKNFSGRNDYARDCLWRHDLSLNSAVLCWRRRW